MEYNYYGKRLSSQKKMLTNSKYTKANSREPDWIKFRSKNTDDDGFDITAIGINGEYRWRYTIPKGTRICRYGSDKGRYTTLAGTAYEKLALPYIKSTVPYHEYVVVRDTVVKCNVERGLVGKNFDSDGGGVQFLHDVSIKEEIRKGSVKEVKTWLIKRMLKLF